MTLSARDHPRTLEVLLYRMAPADQMIALAYTSLLKLPLTHPFRLSSQQTLANFVAYFSLVTGYDEEWVQTAFERRAEELRG